MTDEIKKDSEFDIAVAGAGQRIINAFRYKLQQGGWDLSYENMGGLRRGIEGELIYFGTLIQELPRAGAENATSAEAKALALECRPNSGFDSRDGGQNKMTKHLDDPTLDIAEWLQRKRWADRRLGQAADEIVRLRKLVAERAPE